MAQVSELLIPNAMVDIELPMRPISKTGRRPIRSESHPHQSDVHSCAKEKDEACDERMEACYNEANVEPNVFLWISKILDHKINKRKYYR